MDVRYGFETARVPGDRRARAYCFLRLVAPEAPGDAARAPLNLALVLDRSGSMRGDKLQCVKDAARQLIAMLAPRDSLAVVSYAEDVTTLVPPGPVRNREAVVRLLDGLMARGGTNLSGGWFEGLALVEKHRAKNGINRVLLMTDGLATRGILDAAALVKVAGKKKKKGVATSTFGFGEGFNEDLLISVAKAGGGSFYYIENPDGAPAAFTQELGNLLTVVGQNLSVTVDATGGARILSLLNGYPHTIAPHRLEAQAGDVYAGDARGFVVEWDLPAGLPPEGGVIGRATLEYDDVEAAKRRTVEVEIRASGATGADLGARDPEVVREVALLRSGRAKEAALRKADAGDFGGAREALERCLAELKRDPVCRDALRDEIGELERFLGDFDAAAFDAKRRKTLSASIFASQMSRRVSRPGKPPSTHVDPPPTGGHPPPTLSGGPPTHAPPG